MVGRKRVNLIVGWCGRFLFFVVPRQFSQVVGEWRENQILIPDWTYFHCPDTTLQSYLARRNNFPLTSNDWYFFCLFQLEPLRPLE